jgi:hypothetical protein
MVPAMQSGLASTRATPPARRPDGLTRETLDARDDGKLRRALIVSLTGESS